MKKEEAIKRLKWFKDYNEDDYCGGDRIKNKYGEWYYKVDEEDLEAFDEAIEALEQNYDEEWRKKHYEDSYNLGFLDGVKAVEKRDKPCEDAISRAEAIELASGACHPANVAKELTKLPSVNPQPKTDWIPVSERLPEKPNVYTVTDSKGDVVRFVFNDTESSREYWLRCAKAWMFIEPYIEDGETE